MYDPRVMRRIKRYPRMRLIDWWHRYSLEPGEIPEAHRLPNPPPPQKAFRSLRRSHSGVEVMLHCLDEGLVGPRAVTSLGKRRRRLRFRPRKCQQKLSIVQSYPAATSPFQGLWRTFAELVYFRFRRSGSQAGVSMGLAGLLLSGRSISVVLLVGFGHGV
jgi:hypothetical protein